MQTRSCGKSFLRVLFFSLVAALGLAPLVPTAQASRVNVFEHELGALPTGAWKDEMNQRALDLLDGNDIDFGYFNGTKSVAYFLLESDNYTVLKKGLINNNIPSRTFFTFKTAKYEIVPLTAETDYDSEVGSNIFIAYLLRDKVTQRKYLCVHAAGEKFDTATSHKITSYCKPLKTLVERCMAVHSDARLLIFHSGSATYAKTYDQLLLYADDPTYMGMNLLVSETTAGGLHSDTNSCARKISHFVGSTKVWNDASADFPLVATVAYPHDVKFVDDDGTVITNAVTMDMQTAVAPPDPSKPGFDFLGWEPADFTCVTNDMMIVARYQAAAGSAIVTFKDDDEETVLDTKSVKTGETVSPPADVPTKTGHTFFAWMKDDAPYDFAMPVTEPFDLVASYTANVYTVTFRYGDGEVIDVQQVEYLDDAEAPANPVPKDPAQVFIKWDRDFTAIAEDTVVTAVFIDRQTFVGSAAEFLAYVASGLSAEVSLVLTNDLDFAGLTYTPSDFSATLDGGGRVVTGLSTAPMFNTVYGTVKNLTIRDCNWTKSDACCFLAHKLAGARVENCLVENCEVSGFKTNEGLGGLATRATANDDGDATVVSNCVVRNCDFIYNSASGVSVGGLIRKADTRTLLVDCAAEQTTDDAATIGGRIIVAGGLVGEASCTTFVRCRNRACVKAGYNSGNNAAGGIVGRCVSDNVSASSRPCVFVGCTNEAAILDVGIDGSAGGIVGDAEKTDVTVSRCLNRGAITMRHYSEYEPTASHKVGNGVGGLVGGIYYSVRLIMADSVNYGEIVDDYARSAGGLVGGANSNSDSGELSLYVTNCVNHGSVTAGYAAGGLFGEHSCSFTPHMLNCGNTGAVSCPTGSVGGIFGIVFVGRQNNTKSYTQNDYRNLMNSGTVTTESGVAGGWVGTFYGGVETDAKGNDCMIAPTNLVLTTAVTAGEGGVASNLIGNVVLRGRKVTVADTDTHSLAPGEFTNGSAKRLLNKWVKAQEIVYPKWVRTKNGLDLDIFSSDKFGFALIIQ